MSDNQNPNPEQSNDANILKQEEEFARMVSNQYSQNSTDQEKDK